MKRFFLISMFFFTAILFGCNKDPIDHDPDPNSSEAEPVQPAATPAPISNGAIIIGGDFDQTIYKMDEYPEGTQTKSAAGGVKSGLKAAEELLVGDLKVNSYRFKLVAQMGALEVNLNGETVGVQATHVKISDDGYAFVSYNKRNNPNIGGLVVYKYEVSGETLEKAEVKLTFVDWMRMPNAQINAIDFDGNKLYIAGASDDLRLFGKTRREDPAFLMVMELDVNKKFKKEEPVVKQLTSFQATSIRKYQDRIYITTGDGTNVLEGVIGRGGLYIYKASDCSFVNAILGKEYEYARSVDVDNNNIYLMQSNPARVRKYDKNGNNEQLIYNEANRAMQLDAKTEILAWKDYLFVAENETGLRMLSRNDGKVNDELDAPNKGDTWNIETDVTNSVSMNSDPKKNDKGELIQSDLLLVANGEQGIYWYDIAKDINGKDRIAVPGTNSILADPGKSGAPGSSANFITSKGNVVFVAHGTGGLKVLYVGFSDDDVDPPISSGITCTEFMGYLYFGEDKKQLNSLFPEGQSVFRAAAQGAHPVVRQLFQLPGTQAARDVTLDFIEITENSTELYITFLLENAGWHNALGYFVIPAGVARTDEAEYKYYTDNIRRNLTGSTSNTGVLKDEYIIFRQIKDVNNGGPSMKIGDTWQIGGDKSFNKGDRVVLFMCPNGWNSQNKRVNVTFTAGNSQQIFFMHKYFNRQTGVKYDNIFSQFAGQQMNGFYSADCKSMVFCVEDNHNAGSDCDFNDIIFSVSDNMLNHEVTKFKPPYWAVGKKDDGTLEIFETSKLFDRP